MSEPSQRKYTSPEPRYYFIEHADSGSTVFILQDSENDDAWIEIADPVDAEP